MTVTDATRHAPGTADGDPADGSAPDGDGEQRLARLTRWFERRPNSLEFWELVVTDDRLLWCFVGETYRSLLLRADMGERDRARMDDLDAAAVAAFDDRNFAVPLEDLRELRLVTGTWIRRERLVVRWHDPETGDEEEVVLYRTRNADARTEAVERLAADDRLADVDVSVDSPRSLLPAGLP